MEQKKTCNGCGKHEKESLAIEMCREFKNKAKKWCLVAFVELALLISLLIGYVLK